MGIDVVCEGLGLEKVPGWFGCVVCLDQQVCWLVLIRSENQTSSHPGLADSTQQGSQEG